MAAVRWAGPVVWHARGEIIRGANPHPMSRGWIEREAGTECIQLVGEAVHTSAALRTKGNACEVGEAQCARAALLKHWMSKEGCWVLEEGTRVGQTVTRMRDQRTSTGMSSGSRHPGAGHPGVGVAMPALATLRPRRVRVAVWPG